MKRECVWLKESQNSASHSAAVHCGLLCFLSVLIKWHLSLDDDIFLHVRLLKISVTFRAYKEIALFHCSGMMSETCHLALIVLDRREVFTAFKYHQCNNFKNSSSLTGWQGTITFNSFRVDFSFPQPYMPSLQLRLIFNVLCVTWSSSVWEDLSPLLT